MVKRLEISCEAVQEDFEGGIYEIPFVVGDRVEIGLLPLQGFSVTPSVRKESTKAIFASSFV